MFQRRFLRKLVFGFDCVRTSLKKIFEYLFRDSSVVADSASPTFSEGILSIFSPSCNNQHQSQLTTEPSLSLHSISVSLDRQL